MSGVERPGEMDELIRLVVAEIAADERREREAREAADAQADRAVTDRIAELLTAGPVRARVTNRYCDHGREGVVRAVPSAADDGTLWAYIEDMGPGDDGNPSRYHRPKDLVLQDPVR